MSNAPLSTTLPADAQAILKYAASTGSQVILDQAIKRVRAIYPKYFKPLESEYYHEQENIS